MFSAPWVQRAWYSLSRSTRHGLFLSCPQRLSSSGFSEVRGSCQVRLVLKKSPPPVVPSVVWTTVVVWAAGFGRARTSAKVRQHALPVARILACRRQDGQRCIQKSRQVDRPPHAQEAQASMPPRAYRTWFPLRARFMVLLAPPFFLKPPAPLLSSIPPSIVSCLAPPRLGWRSRAGACGGACRPAWSRRCRR